MNFSAIPHVWAAHPHNWILQFAAEYGLPAALLACYLAWRLLWRCGRTLKLQPLVKRQLFLPAFLAVTVALIYGLVDGNLVMPVSQSVFALCVGVLIGGTLESDDPVRPIAKPVNPSVVASVVVVVVGAAIVAAYCFQTLLGQDASAKEYHEIYSSQRFFVPRFWEQGLLLGGH
jgi:hypothetical protein